MVCVWVAGYNCVIQIDICLLTYFTSLVWSSAVLVPRLGHTGSTDTMVRVWVAGKNCDPLVTHGPCLTSRCCPA